MRPPIAVRTIPALTFKAWLTPPALPSVVATRDDQEVADMRRVYFGGVAGLELGDGPIALAVHGWGGRPAQMAPIARRLAEHGHRVLIPRLPGHAGGERTDIKRAAAALRALVEEVGAPDLIVAHSFAAMVLRLAFPGEGPSRVVLMAPALDVRDALDVFSDRLRLLPWARAGLQTRLRSWDPVLWPEMSGLDPAQLPGASVLIIHDPDDCETPFARSAELAALRPQTDILPMPGAGHSRVLSDPVALDEIVDFASGVELSKESAA